MPYPRRRGGQRAQKSPAKTAEPAKKKKKTETVIEYKSADRKVSSNVYTMGNLETSEKDGLECSWTGKVGNAMNSNRDYTLNFTWDIYWTDLKEEGVENLTGYIIVKPSPGYENTFSMHKAAVDWEDGEDCLNVNVVSSSPNVSAQFEYHLTYYTETDQISYDEMFAASEMNDTVLLVDGKKLHVNKVFLSYHSDFFRALFFSDFKDGKLTEIPIKDVSYEDFGLLMSTIYPKTVFANDRTVEKLLELADRFLMPSVIANVEYHLIHNSKISNEKMMWMADAYGMPTLLKKTIRLLDTVVKAKNLQKSPEYAKLSKDAKSGVLDRLMQLI